MQIETDFIKDNLVLRLNGELDHHSAADLKAKFEAEWKLEAEGKQKKPRNLILNFAGVTFMDSSGVGVIIGRYKQVEQQGGKVAICSPSPAVDKLIQVSGLPRIVSIYGSEDQALKKLK